MSISVVFISRRLTGVDFIVWRWRVPFLIAAVLLVLSVFIRRGLNETAAFLALEESGQKLKNPLQKRCSIVRTSSQMTKVLFSVVAGVGVVFYTTQ